MLTGTGKSREIVPWFSVYDYITSQTEVPMWSVIILANLMDCWIDWSQQDRLWCENDNSRSPTTPAIVVITDVVARLARSSLAAVHTASLCNAGIIHAPWMPPRLQIWHHMSPCPMDSYSALASPRTLWTVPDSMAVQYVEIVCGAVECCYRWRHNTVSTYTRSYLQLSDPTTWRGETLWPLGSYKRQYPSSRHPGIQPGHCAIVPLLYLYNRSVRQWELCISHPLWMELRVSSVMQWDWR